jgi:hypothetical protein
MSKGREKPSLNTLSREMFGFADVDGLIDELKGGNDRAAAITGAAMVDQTLIFQLMEVMHPLTREEFLELFFDNRAILQTMAARIDLSYALKLNDKETITRLHSIRRIRNAFAHATKPLTFGHELVAKECGKLPTPPQASDPEIAHLSEPRRKYTAICVGVYSFFHRREHKPENYQLTRKYLTSAASDLSETA